MIYEIRHLTRYTYGAIVELTTGVLRLAPRSGDGQDVERLSIVTDPASQPLIERFDPFGNRVTSLRIEKPHRQLSITASSRVLINRAPLPIQSPTWETVAGEAVGTSSLGEDGPAIGLYPSRRISLFDEATAIRQRVASLGGVRSSNAASELTPANSFRLRLPRSEATAVSTPAAEAFDRRRGVCQDFAHIMIAAVRGIALPALYVSGYIRTVPPQGKNAPREYADASHAYGVPVVRHDSLGWQRFPTQPTRHRSKVTTLSSPEVETTRTSPQSRA